MTDRTGRAANADPAHEPEGSPGSSRGSRETGGEERSGDPREPGDGGPEEQGAPERQSAPEGREGTGNRDGGEHRDGREDNPFAAPPENQPDKPWQPRNPKGGHGDGSRWGSQWSKQQPGRQDGGFGGPGRRPEQGGEENGGGRRTPGMRWDPTDPKQRHARYALHGGIWGLFFTLFGLIEVGLLLGALSVYWGISALRGPSSVRSVPTAHATADDVAGTDRKTGGGPGTGRSEGERPAGMQVTVTPAQAAKARKTAAIGGLVAGILAVLGVAANFSQQMIYDEYHTCRQDALTQASREKCDELPDEQVPWVVRVTEDSRNEGLTFPGF